MLTCRDRDQDGRLTLTGFTRLVRHQLRVPKHEVGQRTRVTLPLETGSRHVAPHTVLGQARLLKHEGMGGN